MAINIKMWYIVAGAVLIVTVIVGIALVAQQEPPEPQDVRLNLIPTPTTSATPTPGWWQTITFDDTLPITSTEVITDGAGQ